MLKHLIPLIMLLSSSALMRVQVPAVELDVQVDKQPAGQFSYVNTQQGWATLFASPLSIGATGILIHNAWQLESVQPGDEIYLWKGTTRHVYIVKEIHRFTAENSGSVSSSFFSETGEKITAKELYHRMYVKNVLTLQTCFFVGDDPFGGRLFIQAEELKLTRPNRYN